MMYYIKAYTLLIKRVIKKKSMPFHSKVLTITDAALPENKKFLHNGILQTVKMISQGKCRLHWLRD